MAAADNPFVVLNTNGELLILQSLLDNLHDFQGRASKSQIKISEANIVNNFFIKYRENEVIQDLINAYNDLCDIIGTRPNNNLLDTSLGLNGVLNVSGNERKIVNYIEFRLLERGVSIPRYPVIDRNLEGGIISTYDGINNDRLLENDGSYILKQIAGIPEEQEIPENTEFIFMFDACSELTYLFLTNPNVYAIVTPEVIGDSAASSGSKEGYFKEDVMPKANVMPRTPNIENVNPRRVIHFDSELNHPSALGTEIQYGTIGALYQNDAVAAYDARNKTNISEQFDLSYRSTPPTVPPNGVAFTSDGLIGSAGTVKCTSGFSVPLLQKRVSNIVLGIFRPKLTSKTTFNPFRFIDFTNASNDQTEKNNYCFDYKRGGDFNQANSLQKFISKFKETLQGNSQDYITPIVYNDKNGIQHTVYVVFASGDYFSAYHAAKYCGLRSIYFNGYREKRKKSIFSRAASKFSSMMDPRSSIGKKINKWSKNIHTYAIFNITPPPPPPFAAAAAAAPPPPPPAPAPEVKTFNHLQSLCYKFENTQGAPEEEIRKILETAVSLYEFSQQNIEEEITTGGAAAEERPVRNIDAIKELYDNICDIHLSDLFKTNVNGYINNHNIIYSEGYYKKRPTRGDVKRSMRKAKINENPTSYTTTRKTIEDDFDIFMPSYSRMIIHSKSGFPNDAKDCFTEPNYRSAAEENNYSEPLCLFDVLIKFLTDENRNNKTDVFSFKENNKYQFKEIYNDDNDEYYYTYSENPHEIPTSNGFWYGYGRYLNCNDYQIKKQNDFLNKIKRLINAINPSRYDLQYSNIKYVIASLLLFIIGLILKQTLSLVGGGVALSENHPPPHLDNKKTKENHIYNIYFLTVTIEKLNTEFNNYLQANSIVKENKIGLFLNMSDLNEYMKQIYNICANEDNGFIECDKFLSRPIEENKSLNDKLKDFRTKIIKSQINNLFITETLETKFDTLLELLNYFLNTENIKDNVNLQEIQKQLQALQQYYFSQISKGGKKIRKKRKTIKLRKSRKLNVNSKQSNKSRKYRKYKKSNRKGRKNITKRSNKPKK